MSSLCTSSRFVFARRWRRLTSMVVKPRRHVLTPNSQATNSVGVPVVSGLRWVFARVVSVSLLLRGLISVLKELHTGGTVGLVSLHRISYGLDSLSIALSKIAVGTESSQVLQIMSTASREWLYMV